MNELEFNDISNELLIIPKITIDRLYSLENGSDCISLYVFYYKTAKWQKTNIIKANDSYIAKCLNWGRLKINNTKKVLKENNLINIVQKREKGKVVGWYVKINYLFSSENENKLIIENHNTQNPLVDETTCGFEETNALKENIKCLKNKIEMLEEYICKLEKQLEEKKKSKVPTLEEIEEYCKSRNNNVNAKEFYEYYDVANWKDSNGKQIKNWKQKLIYWENRDKKKANYQPRLSYQERKQKEQDEMWERIFEEERQEKLNASNGS